MRNSCSPSFAGDVFDGVFCSVLLPTRCLGRDFWDLIQSVSEGFPSSSSISPDRLSLDIAFPLWPVSCGFRMTC